MSLIDNMMSKCLIMNKQTASDGEGGVTTTWVEGAQIDVAIVLDSSMQAKIAEAQGVTSTYKLTTHQNVSLDYHDVIKRISDGKIFRVTSEANDIVSPSVSNLNMRQVSAEKWSLPL